jgi:hypothetical protein
MGRLHSWEFRIEVGLARNNWNNFLTEWNRLLEGPNINHLSEYLDPGCESSKWHFSGGEPGQTYQHLY